MVSAKRLLGSVAVIAGLFVLAAACTSDPTATPTLSPTSTSTPTLAPTATPTIAPTPTSTPRGILTPTPDLNAKRVASIVFEDSDIVLTMGSQAIGDNEAGQVLRSGDADGWVLKLDVGDKLIVDEISQSASAAEQHRFALPDLFVAFLLDADAGGGPRTNWAFTFFDEGIFAISDGHEHGKAWIAVGDVDLGGYQPVTYVLDQIRVRDNAFELRVGETGYFGYDAAARILSSDEDILITINSTDTLVFTNGLTGSSGNLATYGIAIDAVDLNVTVAPGTDNVPGLELTFDTPGTYMVYDPVVADHIEGTFTIQVNPKPSGAPLPVTYILDQIRLRDDSYELRIGDAGYWGYDAAARVNSADEIRIFLNKGDKLVFPGGLTAGSSNTVTTNITIDGIGLDVTIPPGTDSNLGIEFEFPEAGVYEVYDLTDPARTLGSFFIYVKDPLALPTTYIVDQIRLRDDSYELRMGPTAYWGYDAAERINSADTIRLVLQEGDKIVFTGGLVTGGSNTVTANITIDEIALNLTIEPGNDTNPGIEFEFDNPGVFEVYDSLVPERIVGQFHIIVQ